jgi:hypothetical protein
VGSHYLSVYAVDPGKLKQAGGADRRSLISAILYADKGDDLAKDDVGKEFEAVLDGGVHEEQNDDTAAALEKLLNGDYPKKVECEEAAEIITAFKLLCEHFASQKVVAEVWIGEEETPELWSLITADNDDPFELPSSEYGWPMALYYSNHQLPAVFDILSAMPENDQFYDKPEISDICSVLKTALGTGSDVFVFYED